MKVSFLVAFVAIIAAASLGVGSAAAAPSSSFKVSIAHDCKGLSGRSGWKLAPNAGTHYRAAAQGVTCAFVKTWVARLEGPPHKDGDLKGGPPGWTCTSAHQYFLRCQDAGNVKVFAVSPA